MGGARKNPGSGLIKNGNLYIFVSLLFLVISWSEANALTKRSNSLPAAHQVTLPSLCLFTCKCHLERGRAYNFEVLDSIQKVYFSLVFPPSSLLFFSPTPSNKTNGIPAGIACVYLCGIDLTSKPPREEREKEVCLLFYRQRQKRKRERKGDIHIHTQRKKEKERVETVESVTRANRITLYFPPDEGGGI